MSYKSGFAPPLMASPPNLGNPRVRKVILDESERQISHFKKTYHPFNKLTIYKHIVRMLYMGSARYEGIHGQEQVVFWDPWRRYYHELDDELNHNMLSLMSSIP